MKKLVYRLEHKTSKHHRVPNVNTGVYSCGVPAYKMANSSWSVTPAPWDEDCYSELYVAWNNTKEAMLKYEFFFGFNSVEQLRKWFDQKENCQSYSDDLRIAVYEVPELFSSEHQAIFEGSKAVLVGELDPMTGFD